MDISALAVSFGLVVAAELPDTSGLVVLVLAARLPPRLVLLGASAAFAVHTALAVAAGGLVALLPRRPLEAVLAVAFGLGAFLLLRGDDDDDDVEAPEGAAGGLRAVASSFGVVLLAEFADPSQLVIATLAARYGDLLAVGLGAVAALWSVTAVAVYGGRRLARVVPTRWLTRAAAAVLVVLAVVTGIDAAVG